MYQIVFEESWKFRLRVFESTMYKTLDFPTFLFFGIFPITPRPEGMGVEQQRDCDPTDYSPKQTCCFLGVVFCSILQIFFLKLCQGLHCLFTTSLGLTQNYPKGCTVLYFFVIRTLCSSTRKWNYWTGSDILQNKPTILKHNGLM